MAEGMQQRINLNLRVAQKQVLTPGLVQMVSVLALNKLELRDMITAEMVENPVLEELADGEMETDAEEVARMITLIAGLPDETNVFETLMLPIGQPYFGRG